MRGGKQPSIGKDWLYLLFLIRVYFPRKRITRSQIITRLLVRNFRNSLRSSAVCRNSSRKNSRSRKKRQIRKFFFARRESNLGLFIKLLFSAKIDYILQSQIPTQLLLSVVAKFTSIQCIVCQNFSRKNFRSRKNIKIRKFFFEDRISVSLSNYYLIIYFPRKFYNHKSHNAIAYPFRCPKLFEKKFSVKKEN